MQPWLIAFIIILTIVIAIVIGNIKVVPQANA